MKTITLFRKLAIVAACSTMAILLLVGLGLNHILCGYVMEDAERGAVSLTNGIRDREVREFVGRAGAAASTSPRMSLPSWTRTCGPFSPPSTS